MAEQFLTLMADLDDDSQTIMSAWYNNLIQAGFKGTQTPNLPFHISLASFPLEKEQEAVELTKKIAGEFSPIPVHISHIGIFAPGKVLFGGPERNTELDLLHNACDTTPDPQRPWTPHVTMLIDEPTTICKAHPFFLESFDPFVGLITRLHLLYEPSVKVKMVFFAQSMDFLVVLCFLPRIRIIAEYDGK